MDDELASEQWAHTLRSCQFLSKRVTSFDPLKRPRNLPEAPAVTSRPARTSRHPDQLALVSPHTANLAGVGGLGSGGLLDSGVVTGDDRALQSEVRRCVRIGVDVSRSVRQAVECPNAQAELGYEAHGGGSAGPGSGAHTKAQGYEEAEIRRWEGGKTSEGEAGTHERLRA